MRADKYAVNFCFCFFFRLIVVNELKKEPKQRKIYVYFEIEEPVEN